MLCLETGPPGVTEAMLSLCSYSKEVAKCHPWGQAAPTAPSRSRHPRRDLMQETNPAGAKWGIVSSSLFTRSVPCLQQDFLREHGKATH